jgi:hypothetical protein
MRPTATLIQPRRLVVPALVALAATALWAQAPPPRVLVSDHPVNSYIAGAGAPAHVVGLERMTHDITLNTGRVPYGLRYTVAKDPKDPAAAVPAEGYVGMSKPADANWYGGGFFDLKLNGQSLGTRMVKVFAGRSTGDRGYVDYVFDVPQAIVRLRFLVLAGGDCLYLQVLLDPREELQRVDVSLRCYPCGYIQGPSRRVLTATRELKSGARAAFDLAQESWANYYDSSVAQGPAHEGSCSVLWPPGQTCAGSVTVGSYSVDTDFQLDPARRDLRFIFFDHTGASHADAQAGLKARAPALLQELAALDFADATVVNWPLAEKQAQTATLLAALPEGQRPAARYEQWSRDLETQLRLVRSGSGGGLILAEAKALKTIMEWEKSLPDLRLQALLSTL